MRVMAIDAPGVMAKLTAAFSDAGISIASVLQREAAKNGGPDLGAGISTQKLSRLKGIRLIRIGAHHGFRLAILSLMRPGLRRQTPAVHLLPGGESGARSRQSLAASGGRGRFGQIEADLIVRQGTLPVGRV